MKATGIVRRIDDLGRVVIPKEIRRTLRLREGTPLEIFTDREGEIILKKYSPMAELGTFAKQYAESLAQTFGHTVCITDRDQIIAAAGLHKKELVNRQISKPLENIVMNRDNLYNGVERKIIPIYVGDNEEYTTQIVQPIVCQGDIIGSVIIFCLEDRAKFTEVEQKAILCAATFLGSQMEE